MPVTQEACENLLCHPLVPVLHKVGAHQCHNLAGQHAVPLTQLPVGCCQALLQAAAIKQWLSEMHVPHWCSGTWMLIVHNSTPGLLGVGVHGITQHWSATACTPLCKQRSQSTAAFARSRQAQSFNQLHVGPVRGTA